MLKQLSMTKFFQYIERTPLLIYINELLLFILIVTNAVPRESALILGAYLAIYAIFSRLEHGVLVFVWSVPIFIALPLAETFDQFNTWRIISTILFLKWMWINRRELWIGLKYFFGSPLI